MIRKTYKTFEAWTAKPLSAKQLREIKARQERAIDAAMRAPKNQRKKHRRARSAITGRFVSMTYAKRYPHRVVIERF